MDFTNETETLRPQDPVCAVLARAMGTDERVVSSALFDALDRLGLALSVKEVATGRYLHVNPAMAAIFGRSVDEFSSLGDTDLMDEAQAAAIRGCEQAALVHPPPPSEQRIERDGRRREFRVVRTALPQTNGGPSRHVLSVWVESTVVNQLESQLQQALAQLEQQQVSAEAQRRGLQDQNLRDSETGLYHRLHFDDQLRREVDLSSREHREFALVVIALDPLSVVAKELGAGARARVLEALGTLLRSNTRAMDASCRLDEDRFAILLSGVGLATAHSRMEGLRRQCATQIVVLDGRDIGFTVSMGVASFPHTASTEDGLMVAAEKAQVEARRRGGNHVTLASIRFDPKEG